MTPPTNEPPCPPRRAVAWLTGAALLGLLGAPGALTIVSGADNVARAGEIERRRPTPAPRWPWAGDDARPRRDRDASFADTFDAWFDDAVGGREAALRANARLSRRLFGTSPADHLVFGRDDWVFSREARSLESFCGVDPLGAELLVDHQRALEDRGRWLAARGIDHVVVYVPHKSSIYPDKLPEGIERARGTSRLEEFLAWMAERSDVRVLDVAPALRAARAGDGPWRHVYSPHGVHWSGIGGHAAYEVVVRDLAERHGAPPPLPLEAFDVVDQDGEGDSWASRMLLDGVIDMENLALVPRRPSGVTDGGRPPGGTGNDFCATHPDTSRPRVLLVHDSFGPDIRKLFALHASYLEARWTPYLQRDVVERVEPDVVIELYSELALVTRPPFRRAEFVGDETRARHAAAEVTAALDLGGPLTFDPFPERVRAETSPDGARVTVERGVGYLALGELPARPAGGEVFVGLRLSAERPGTLALYCGASLDRAPDVSELQPVEVAAEARDAIVPLPRTPAGTRAWLVLPRSLGTITLEAVDVRVAR